MRSLYFTAIFEALVVLVTVAQVGASPFQRRKTLDVFNPRITQPNAYSTWTAGAEELVSWDTSDAPSSISNQGHVVLKTVPNDPNSLSEWFHLAGPFELTINSINVTVPNGLLSGPYRIILFGDSGNESPTFHVDGSDDPDGQNPPNDNNNPFGRSDLNAREIF